MRHEEALLALIRDADPILRKLCGRIRGSTVNGHTGEDLCQIVALKCIQYIHRKGVPPPSKAYLVRIGRNTRASLARKNCPKELSAEQLDSTFREGADPAETTAQEDERRLRWGALRSALASLRPKDEEIIRLHVLEGQSHESIARLCGRTANAVRTRFYRAMARLRAMLEAKGVVI